MKNIFVFLSLLGMLIFWSSCRDDFEFKPSTGNLEFSRDTVYLDTIFTNIGSSTYNLKVSNKSNKDLVIPTVRLTNGQNSNYRLNVDGIAGKEFSDVEILAKDSLFIFIETTVDINETVATENQFLYTDAIEFDSGENQQKVQLVTLVKDAIFIYPNQITDPETGSLIKETLRFDVDGDGVDDETVIEGRFLRPEELIFSREKPYVIYGYAAVGASETLLIEAGARVHFHANSGLIITAGGSIKVEGAFSNDQELMENEVIFEGDRLEPDFSDVPGQWGTIWLFNNSIENEFYYTTIKNASVGILSEGNQDASSPKLYISNSQIYNSSNFGILGRASSITAENVVLNNSGQSSFAGTFGGKYNFTHCTIANYWSNSFRQFPALFLNNYIVDEDNNTYTNDLDEANFENCIVYGNDNPELILDKENGSSFNFKFSNSLILFNDPNNLFNDEVYNFDNNDYYENNIFNRDPNFLDPAQNKLIIGEESGAIGIGNSIYANQIPFDILNVDRRDNPDAGAYQHIMFED